MGLSSTMDELTIQEAVTLLTEKCVITAKELIQLNTRLQRSGETVKYYKTTESIIFTYGKGKKEFKLNNNHE